MSNHAMPRKGWRRAARGTMLGTAAAGVLLLSGSTPTVAVPCRTGPSPRPLTQAVVATGSRIPMVRCTPLAAPSTTGA